MLDVTYQAMEMTAAMIGAAQGASNQSSGGQTKADGKSDFDSMIEQKQQEARGQQTQKTGTDAAKGKAEPAVKDEEIPDEQYAAAVAMMFQAQPEIRYMDVSPDTEEATTQELVPDVGLPAAELPVLSETQGAAAQIVTEQPAEQSAELPVEAAAMPAEIAPQQTNSEPQQETGNSAPQEGQVRAQREDGPAPENVRMEAPVFGNVSAAPVKVALPQGEPLELEAPNATVELVGRIEDLFADGVDSRVEFMLVPESLGKITVQITHGVDGALHVLLSASTERAAAMLERHAGSLQDLLTSNGRTQTQVEVRGNEESQRQFLNPNGENNQGRQQQGQQRRQQPEHRTQDFVQQLRLGLIGRDSDE